MICFDDLHVQLPHVLRGNLAEVLLGQRVSAEEVAERVPHALEVGAGTDYFRAVLQRLGEVDGAIRKGCVEYAPNLRNVLPLGIDAEHVSGEEEDYVGMRAVFLEHDGVHRYLVGIAIAVDALLLVAQLAHVGGVGLEERLVGLTCPVQPSQLVQRPVGLIGHNNGLVGHVALSKELLRILVLHEFGMSPVAGTGVDSTGAQAVPVV